MSNSNDFPLVEAPAAGRKGVFSIAMVLFSFTFFTGTMFAGGKLGVSFSIVHLLWIAVIGNALLALYAASLGWIAARSGLNTVLMGRFCFGEIGSKLADFILGFAELGWYAWGTATVAISLVKILALPEALTQPLMVLFGILFCVTALVGYKGLDALSRLSVPLMFVLLMVSMYPEDQYALRCLKAGAHGYANKSGDPMQLIEAVRVVHAGRKFLTPEVAQMLADSLTQPTPEAPHAALSEREMQTLQKIATGKRLTDIAEELMLSPKTVSVYRARVLEKLQLSNNAELTVYAIRNNLV